MTDYNNLTNNLDALLSDTKYSVTILSNAVALIWDGIEEINWAGFYLAKNDILILGPFQGKPACTEIKCGKGVCGTAMEKDSLQLVKNVHEFPGHIACDSASNSEIVVPIHRNGKFYGVLDIDSPQFERFKECDAKGLSEIVEIIEKYLNKTEE